MDESLNGPLTHRPARAAGLLIALALSAASVPPFLGQTSTPGSQQYDTSYLEPPPEAGRGKAAPRLTFSLATEIPLPGPLPARGPRLLENRVRIPVAGGLADSGWTEGAVARIVDSGEGEPPSPEEADLEWVLAPGGRARYAVTAEGFLMAQKKCGRCVAGWRRRWKLKVAGVGLAPPLVTEKRIFYGGLDNKVYGLKRRNGHRVWVADLEGRVSRSLRLWWLPSDAGEDDAEPTAPLTLVLVVPDDGSGIVALDSRSGATVASYDLPEDGGTLIGAPVVTPDGKVVVARQKYTPADASLMVFRLVAPPQPA